MSNVLRAVEHAKSQSREKVPRRQIASDRTNLESCLPLQELADVLQLRNVVLAISTVLDQSRPVLQVLGHSVLHVELVQLPQDSAPSFHFFLLQQAKETKESWLALCKVIKRAFIRVTVYLILGMGFPLQVKQVVAIN